MAQSLTDSQKLNELADLLYDFLPASRAPFTFGDAALNAGVGSLWLGPARNPPAGHVPLSKRAALPRLLEQTFDQERGRFCDLIESIVRGALRYRQVKGNPLTRKEIDAVRTIVAALRFKIPALEDPRFLAGLAGAPATPTPVPAPTAVGGTSKLAAHYRKLDQLRDDFVALQAMADRQEAGRKFEGLLNRLFSLFGLEPSAPFRVVGEQIDGAFVLDAQVYLVEAKWTADRTDAAKLYTFRAKVEGKATFTRGLFISVAGYTDEAQEAVGKNKMPNFLMVDGSHVYRVLMGGERLDAMLRTLVRLWGERGVPYVPVADISARAS